MRKNNQANTSKRPVPAKRRSRVKPLPIKAESALVIDELARDLSTLFRELGIGDRIAITKRAGRLARQKLVPRAQPANAHAIGELLTVWHQDPNYLDSTGNPIPLRLDGRNVSFRMLAKKSAPKLSVTYLLDELTKLGVLTVDAAGSIRVKSRSLPVYNDAELASLHTLRTLRGFIGTLKHNLHSGPEFGDQLFHRLACNGDLNETDIPRLRIWLQRHGQNLLEAADNWMNNQAKPGRSERPSKRKLSQVSIGLYLAVE